MVFIIINAYSNYPCRVIDQKKNCLKGIAILCGYFCTHTQNVKSKALPKCIYFNSMTLLFKNKTQPKKSFQSLMFKQNFKCFEFHKLMDFSLFVYNDKFIVIYFFPICVRLLTNLCAFMCLQIHIFVLVNKIST